MIAAEDEVLTAHGRAALAGMLASAGPLDAGAAPEGVMIAAKPGLGSGLGRELALKWRDEPGVRIAFTGHVGSGTLAAELVDARLRRLRALERASAAVRPHSHHRRR